jgi:hypothetical protein
MNCGAASAKARYSCSAASAAARSVTSMEMPTARASPSPGSVRGRYQVSYVRSRTVSVSRKVSPANARFIRATTWGVSA